MMDWNEHGYLSSLESAVELNTSGNQDARRLHVNLGGLYSQPGLKGFFFFFCIL